MVWILLHITSQTGNKAIIQTDSSKDLFGKFFSDKIIIEII